MKCLDRGRQSSAFALLLSLGIALCLWFAGTTACSARLAARPRILILKTRDNAFYNALVEGLVNGLKTRGFRNGSQIELVVATLSGDSDADSKQMRGQLSRQPQLAITVGTDAAALLAKEKPGFPMLFSMVLDPVSQGLVKSLEMPGGNCTGTTLLVSPGKQLDCLAQAVPAAHKIGALYTDQDATSLAFLAEAKRDAERLHLEIIARPIKPGDSVSDALQALSGVEALWLIPDPASTGASAMQNTLEFARARHLPVLGASAASARAGALLALSANLQDMGDVTAEMAAHLLDGTTTPAQMRVRGPRRTLLAINMDAARALGLKIPEAMLHLADDVIDTRREGE